MSEKIDSESLAEIQMLEQNLHSISMQKQAFDFELSESEHALEELENSDGEVFKIIGSVMIKSDKDSIKTEIEKKVKLLNLRLKAMDSQEKQLSERAEKIREEFTKKKPSK
ncbi:MAG: prefoldin subunit beta [Nanoarchaeota archaeon]